MNNIIKEIIMFKKKIFTSVKTYLVTIMIAFYFFITSTPVFAGDLNGSVFVTGTKKLFDDGKTALLIFIPIVGAVMIIWNFIAKMMGDEMEHTRRNKTIKTIFITLILAEGVTALITLITGYYGFAN